MKDIEIVKNKKARVREKKCDLKDFSSEVMSEVRNFHRTLPDYTPTPLESLSHLAKKLGVKQIFVKDESKRFGLNAFKVLGGSYAMGKYIAQTLDMNMNELPFDRMISSEIKEKLGNVTFVTATDGNHGRGVAWTANQLKQRAKVYMPKGSVQMRYDNIVKEGAYVEITDLNYDDAVRKGNSEVEENVQKGNGYVMVQDTAWEGYEEIPLWIMQGYATIMSEILEQLADTKPTHLFVQAGVGSFAGAMQGLLSKTFAEERPFTVICEPHGANCIYTSFQADDGKPHNLTGDLPTIMAGLACGEPSTISYKILNDYSDFSVSCHDKIAAKGMRVLSNPLGNDTRIISGESGAVGVGVVATLLDPQKGFSDIAKAIGLDKNSIVLCISTEGDTDIDGFREVVWEGFCPSCD